MSEIEISVICTIKNEESSIEEFLISLLSQTRSADEIIIVDGGSTDNTINIIRKYSDGNDLIKLISKPGVNIAQGRNIAVKESKYEYIASTDAGCTVDKNWLANIVKGFDSGNVDVVSGFYLPDARTLFEECVAEVTFIKLKNINPNKFLPSSRSIAFTKKAWGKVGGYPEWLYTAEDTLFDLALKKNGFNFFFSQNAIVYWKPRENIKKLARQMYLYGKGDGEAKILTKYYMFKLVCLVIIFSISLINITYALLLFLLILSIRTFPHIINSVYLTNKKNTYMQVLIFILTIICCVEVSSLAGYIMGLKNWKKSLSVKKHSFRVIN